MVKIHYYGKDLFFSFEIENDFIAVAFSIVDYSNKLFSILLLLIVLFHDFGMTF